MMIFINKEVIKDKMKSIFLFGIVVLVLSVAAQAATTCTIAYSAGCSPSAQPIHRLYCKSTGFLTYCNADSNLNIELINRNYKSGFFGNCYPTASTGCLYQQNDNTTWGLPIFTEIPYYTTSEIDAVCSNRDVAECKLEPGASVGTDGYWNPYNYTCRQQGNYTLQSNFTWDSQTTNSILANCPLDVNSPNIVLNTPSDAEQFYENDLINFSCYAFDHAPPYPIKNHSLIANFSGNWLINLTVSNFPSNESSLNTSLVLTAGTYAWSCQACDNNNNCNNSMINRTVIVNPSLPTYRFTDSILKPLPVYQTEKPASMCEWDSPYEIKNTTHKLYVNNVLNYTKNNTHTFLVHFENTRNTSDHEEPLDYQNGTFQIGYFGQAIEFTNASSNAKNYINYSEKNTFNMTEGTITAYVNMNTTGQLISGPTLFSWRYNSSTKMRIQLIGLQTSDTYRISANYWYNDGSNTADCQTEKIYHAGEWHRIDVTWGNNKPVKCYVDGNFINQSADIARTPLTTPSDTKGFLIGNWIDAAHSPVNIWNNFKYVGKIDEFQIVDYAKTSRQILYEYEQNTTFQTFDVELNTPTPFVTGDELIGECQGYDTNGNQVEAYNSTTYVVQYLEPPSRVEVQAMSLFSGFFDTIHMIW